MCEAQTSSLITSLLLLAHLHPRVCMEDEEQMQDGLNLSDGVR